MIVNEVLEPHIVFVSLVDSWPENLFKSKYATMIFNTDYENEVGKHWVAIYIDGKMNSAYIFDSNVCQYARVSVCPRDLPSTHCLFQLEVRNASTLPRSSKGMSIASCIA